MTIEDLHEAWERARRGCIREAPYPDRGSWCAICLTHMRDGHAHDCPVRIMDDAVKASRERSPQSNAAMRSTVDALVQAALSVASDALTAQEGERLDSGRPLRLLGGRSASEATPTQVEHARLAMKLQAEGGFYGSVRDLADYMQIVRIHGAGA